MTTLDLQSPEELRLAPEEAAERAGMTYVTDAVPGITRERSMDGWRYRRPDGAVVADPDERARIEAIGIPLAWTPGLDQPTARRAHPGHRPRGRRDALVRTWIRPFAASRRSPPE